MRLARKLVVTAALASALVLIAASSTHAAETAAPTTADASAEPASEDAPSIAEGAESLTAATAAVEAGGSAGAATGALTATGSPAAEGDLPIPEMTTEEAIAAVKFGIQLIRDGSYAAGLAVLWLVLLWGSGRFIYPRVKGLLSNTVQNVLVASVSFTSILATAIVGGLVWYMGLLPAVIGSGLATVIWATIQKKGAKEEAGSEA